MKSFVCKAITLLTVLMLAGCSTAVNEATPEASFLNVEVEGEITIYLYNAAWKDYLETAAKHFMEKYPGTTINVEVFSTGPKRIIVYDSTGAVEGSRYEELPDESQNQLDYINRLNTEIMSGKGPDIIAADIIPYYKYAESGAFIDMLPYMNLDLDFNESDYRTAVLDAAKYNEGQYVMPLSFYFKFFAYDSSLFTEAEQELLDTRDQFTYSQLIDIGKSPFDRSEDINMFCMGMDNNFEASNLVVNMFFNIFDTNYTSFVDVRNREVYINDGRFVALLESIKEYIENGYIMETVPSDLVFFHAGFTHDSLEYQQTKYELNKKFFYKLEESFNLLQHFYKDIKSWYMSPGMGIRTFEDDIVAGMVASDSGDIDVTLYQAYGINANSTNKRTAWEFIKFMLSEEMQMSGYIAHPMNIAAFEARTKIQMMDPTNWRNLIMPTAPPSFPDELQEAYDNYMACFDKYSNMINTEIIRDATIDIMIKEEIKNYLNATKTSAEIAQILQQKIELYLNE